MVYTGALSYSYWGIGDGDPSLEQNIPFNPIKDFQPPQPKYVDEEFRTYDSLDVKYVKTTELVPGEGPLPMLFKDPFLLMTIFTHKVVSGTWGTGGVKGIIQGDFTDVDDIDKIWIQNRLKDYEASNDLDRLLIDGRTTKYNWLVEPGKYLQEVPDFKFNDFEDNTRPPAISNDFHDQSFGSGVGGWGNWDNSGCGGSGLRSVTDMVITWGGNPITAIAVKNMDLNIEAPYESAQLRSSLAHTKSWQGPRRNMFSIAGLLDDLTTVADQEKKACDRTKADLIVYYDATVGYEKYIKMTNIIVSPESDTPAIPEAGKPTEASVVFAGGNDSKASYYGAFLDRPDPSALITTSP